MNKIKYKDRNLKNKIQKTFKDVNYNINNILLYISSIYCFNNPFVIKYELDYDEAVITLDEKDEDIKPLNIHFNLDKNNFFFVKKEGSLLLDNYVIIQNKVFIIDKTYQNNKQVFRKLYSPSDEDYIEFKPYNYTYKNEYLNAKMNVNIKKTTVFNEENFIQNILKKCDFLVDIDRLFETFQMFFKSQSYSISIINKTIFGDEKVVVSKGKLIEYKKYILEDGKVKFLNYMNDKLIVSTEEDFDFYPDTQDIKKLVKRKG